MNVLMITSLLPHAESLYGGGVVMHGQYEALAASHRVTLLSMAEDTPSERAAADKLVRAGVDLHVVWRPAPGSLRRWTARARLALSWLRSREPLRSLAFHHPDMQRLIDRMLRERSIDLIQVEDNAMGGYRYPGGIPRVLTEHEVRDADVGESYGLGVPGRADAARWRDYQVRVWDRFDRIQVFTPRDAASIEAIAPHVAERVRVNPFGIALPPPADPALERPNELVFVGGFQHAPNVDAACWLVGSILPKLRKHVPDARLTIVGSDPPPRVMALVGPNVEVTGRVPDVRPWLERAAVVVAPIRTGGGMRVKVLQAVALGKAVVTTTLGAEGISPDDPPFRIADEPAAFALACAELLSDRALRRGIGRRARLFVAEHHTWDAYADRLESLYAELLETEGVGESIADLDGEHATR